MTGNALDAVPWESVPASGASNAIRAPIESQRARNELTPPYPVPVPASELGPGPAVEWLWHGYLARKSTTLLTGLWKAGKTTLVAHLLKLTAEGGQLVGPVARCKVLVVSEEASGLWAQRRDAIGIGDHVHFILRPFKGKPDFGQWQGFVGHLNRLVVENGFGLVVLDPLANLLPVRDENDAAAMIAALTPLYAITEVGAAVLLLHHPRKGDGGEGQAARGSGALPGFVDIIVELRRFNAAESEDRRRTLTAFSRYDETPHEAVIELTDDGYRSCGTKADAAQGDRLEALAELIPTEPLGLTADEIRAAWPAGGIRGITQPGKRTVENDLRFGAGGGRWIQTGNGRKGDPFRYHAPDSFRAATLSIGVRESNPTGGPPPEGTLEYAEWLAARTEDPALAAAIRQAGIDVE